MCLLTRADGHVFDYPESTSMQFTFYGRPCHTIRHTYTHTLSLSLSCCSFEPLSAHPPAEQPTVTAIVPSSGSLEGTPHVSLSPSVSASFSLSACLDYHLSLSLSRTHSLFSLTRLLRRDPRVSPRRAVLRGAVGVLPLRDVHHARHVPE
jgi:hypothetical protein